MERMSSSQRRCASCQVEATRLVDRRAHKRWESAMRKEGRICCRCDVPVASRGMCAKCKLYVAEWKRKNPDKLRVMTPFEFAG